MPPGHVLDEAEIVPGKFVIGIPFEDLQIKLTRNAVLFAVVEFDCALKERGFGEFLRRRSDGVIHRRPRCAGRRRAQFLSVAERDAKKVGTGF